VTVTTGAPVDVTDIEPYRPLAELYGAELDGLHSVLLAGADASDDEAAAVWCTRIGQLIVADGKRCLVGRRRRVRSRCFLTVSRFASAGVCRGWYRRKLRELPERSGVYVFVNRQDECFDGTVEIIDVLMTRLFTIDEWLY
jgi:hypothetical protein